MGQNWGGGRERRPHQSDTGVSYRGRPFAKYSKPQVLQVSVGEESRLRQRNAWWFQSVCPRLSLLAARGGLARPGFAARCYLVRALCRKTRLGGRLWGIAAPVPGLPPGLRFANT